MPLLTCLCRQEGREFGRSVIWPCSSGWVIQKGFFPHQTDFWLPYKSGELVEKKEWELGNDLKANLMEELPQIFQGWGGTSDFLRSSLQNVHPAIKETGRTDCAQDRWPLAVTWSRLRLEPWGGGGQVNGIGIRSTRRLLNQKQDALYLFTEGFPTPGCARTLPMSITVWFCAQFPQAITRGVHLHQGEGQMLKGEPRLLGCANFLL